MHINATLLDFGLMKVEMVSLSLQHTFLGPVSSPCREGGGGGGWGGEIPRYHSHQGSRQSLSNSIHFPFCLRQATGSVHNYSYGPQCFYLRLREPQFHLAKARKYGNMLTYQPLLSLHWPGYSALHCRSP